MSLTGTIIVRATALIIVNKKGVDFKMEYGSGIKLGTAFEHDKERIKHALKGEIMVGENGHGFIYDKCTKEEADAYILSAFDNAVYQALKLNASARVLESMIEEYKKEGLKRDTYADYLASIFDEETRMLNTYKFESDEIEDECVIDGD